MKHESRVYEALIRIFPNADLSLFLHFYNFWGHDLDIALWCYGEIKRGDYLQEKALLKNALEDD